MRLVLSLILLALAATAHAAAPELKVPAEVKGQPGSFLVVRADTPAKVVKWYCPDPGLSLFPSDLLSDKKTAVVVGQKPGRYRLVAFAAQGDEPSDPAVCVLVIGDAPPPTPPGPTPPTPPDDPLAKDLAAAYAADQGADREKHLASLVELYRQAPTLASDASLKTTGDLLGVLRNASGTLLPQGALPATRQRIAAYLAGELGTDAAAELTAPLRQKATAAFSRVRAALEAVR